MDIILYVLLLMYYYYYINATQPYRAQLPVCQVPLVWCNISQYPLQLNVDNVHSKYVQIASVWPSLSILSLIQYIHLAALAWVIYVLTMV